MKKAMSIADLPNSGNLAYVLATMDWLSHGLGGARQMSSGCIMAQLEFRLRAGVNSPGDRPQPVYARARRWQH